MSSQGIYEELTELWVEFVTDHAKAITSGNKVAASRARKSLIRIKERVTSYRKQSIAESKEY